MKSKSFIPLFTILLALLLLQLPVFAIDTTKFPKTPQLYAQAAVLMDADTGQVLYGKVEHQKMYPASLTKIMTCLLAMEYGKYDDIVTIRKEALKNIAGTTHIALSEGEQLPLEQLMYATMLESANDAAASIGIHLAGSTEMFSEQMNKKAAELGAIGTHFVNANGLPDNNHYSTAYDMAIITREALKHPEFRKFAGTHQYTIPATNKNKERIVTHRNYMFVLNDTYEGAFAGKTGWTQEAGKCLMTVAKRNGITLICVVLKCSGATDPEFKDSTVLFDYGFDNFRRVTIPWSRFPSQQVAYTNSAGQECQGRIYPAFDATGNMPVLLSNGVDEDDLKPNTFLPDPLTETDFSRVQFELKLPEVAGEVQNRLAGVYPVEIRPLDIQAEIGVAAPIKKPFPWLLLMKIIAIVFLVLLFLFLLTFWLAGKLARMYYRSYFNTNHREISPESKDLYKLAHYKQSEQDWIYFRKQYQKQFRLFGATLIDIAILIDANRAASKRRNLKKLPPVPKVQENIRHEPPEYTVPSRNRNISTQTRPRRSRRPFDK